MSDPVTSIAPTPEVPPPAFGEVEARLLAVLQESIPLVDHPFLDIAVRLGIGEQEVLERVAAFRSGPRGVIRQISAIFDSRSLGYDSCLVAAKVDESLIDAAAGEICLHPGVSHCYRREHAYNLWYTLAVPPTSRLGLSATADILHARSGAAVTRLMPALKVYKIGVKFDVGVDHEPLPFDTGTTRPIAPATVRASLDGNDLRMIAILQQDLPLVTQPFERWAQQAGVPTAALLDAARRYLESGVMRRFSAVLRHRHAGFTANAMGAWVVPESRHDEFGKIAASSPSVSHCYVRPTYPDWPYSVFTMVHGKSVDQCEAALAAISASSGIRHYDALYSTHEFKKVRVRYFAQDAEMWESSVQSARHPSPARTLAAPESRA